MKIMKTMTGNGVVNWVACVGLDGRLYSYVHLAHRFQFNHGLDHDYYWEQENEYVDITTQEAIQLIKSGVGRLGGDKEWIARNLIEAEWSLSASEVLGEASQLIENSEA